VDHDVLEGAELQIECRAVCRLTCAVNGKESSLFKAHDIRRKLHLRVILQESVVSDGIRDILSTRSLPYVELHVLVGAQGHRKVATRGRN